MSRAASVPNQLSFLPFSGSHAVAAGLLSKRMLAGPAWCRLLPDVYVHAAAFDPDDHRMWCNAVALKLPAGAAVCGLSAAYLWGVDLLPRRSPVHVVLPRTGRIRRHPRIAVTNSTLAVDDTVLLSAVPMTTEVRTAFDLGRTLPRPDAVAAVDALLHDAGLPRPVPQHKVADPQGRFIGRVDLAYPQWRIALEYEGDHHRGRATFRRDVHRYNALRAAGWLVLRFTADHVLRRSGQVAQDVRQAIDERRTSRRAQP
ncbi:endonuclease domain-containing protein [Micromonospora sp. LOL_021]|uniref:endonuclease domain-containing protein n=1 Tax=Micromonospora sp. LOL_021 TaxID=3345417 RepID=UPI003A8AD182